MFHNEESKLTEEEYWLYQNFLTFLNKKNVESKQTDFIYGVGAKMAHIQICLEMFDLTGYCNLEQTRWGASEMKEMASILKLAKKDKGYNKVKDDCSVYEIIKEINEACESQKESGTYKAEERLYELEVRIGEVHTDTILKYFVEVFRAVWDKEEVNWNTYQMTKMFEEKTMKRNEKK